MGILEGFIRTKRHRLTENGWIKQSEWTHPSSIEFDDGQTLDIKIESHPQNASDIKAGTFGGQVSAPAGTDYSTNRLRNQVLTNVDPGEGASTSYVDGSIICFYE